MKILFVAAEVAPYVSVGGLSQVMLFLPKALNKKGNDARVFTAKYGSMDKTAPKKKAWKLNMELQGLAVPIKDDGGESLICNIKTFPASKNNMFTYFLENREYYELRANVFGYKDDHVRFALLSKGCLEWLLHQYNLKKKAANKESVWWPEIIHCNDWHTGYFVDMARNDPKYSEMLSSIPIIFTVHNFTFQGNYEFKYQDPKDQDDYESPLLPLLDNKLVTQNALARGIKYADAVNTVSPTHAAEVLTHEYAEGLDELLLESRGKLTGILNGLDTTEFNPSTDPLVYENFNFRSFERQRRENKLYLQKLFLLPQDATAPLIGSSGRISYQKGWDLVLEILDPLLSTFKNLQIVVLGGGDEAYRLKLSELKEKYPRQVGLHLRPDFRIPRKIFSGADMFLIPSMFEPGGIVAVEALRYGAVPIVRRTGGLNDTIEEFNPNTGQGNGFSFTNKDSWELLIAIVRALTVFEQPSLWKRLVSNCLKCDFSWDHVAKLYFDYYRKVIEAKKRGNTPISHPAYLVPHKN